MSENAALNTDTKNTDVIVIGLGPAGETVGGMLAEAGLDVVGIEGGLVGGECPYWGCVPSKMMIRASNLIAESRRVGELAGSSTTTPDWAPVARRIREQATDNWDDTVAVDRFVGKGGTFVRGYATITGPNSVQVNNTTYVASRGLVIATGTLAAVPPIPGLADTPYWTNHQIVEVELLPKSLIVLGGGAIGTELAQVMARFGVKVTIVEGLDHLLPRNEPEAGQMLAEVFTSEGIDVRTGQFASSVAFTDNQFVVSMPDGTEIAGEKLLVATGRRTFLKELGVEALGLAPAAFLKVDGRQRVAEGLWAAGDIAGDGLFTHLATRQGAIVAADILGEEVEELNLDSLPAVTFTDPEVGAVGLTEAEARAKGLNVRVVTKLVGHTARGWLHSAGNEGFTKLIVDADRGVLVGATSAGPAGGEVLGMLTLAVHAEIPIATLRSMIYAYPTFHKGVEDALNDLE
ncbi:MAG: pyruvate/2-oxoglutarate dehydrogenase complex dihydrolipoamide dehydrogenase (E3) component [Candidatus Poriferisodalaceae bacterium]|jgi:pyruvate/2-oxoglutarate dehydrogenase complex dihydrolipoamide dehydrogenase (E3) component